MLTRRRGFISPLLLALVALLVIGGGAYVYVEKKQASQPEVATSTAQTTSAAISMPNCTMLAQPQMADWISRKGNNVTLTWSSENGENAYLWLVAPMGGDIVDGTIKKGTHVPLQGSETVTVRPEPNDPQNYALVIKNTRGAAFCDTYGSKQFRTQEELENPYLGP